MYANPFINFAENIDFGGLSAALNAILIFLSFYFLFVFAAIAAGVALYYLNAVGIYKMSVSAGIKNPWYSFIPFFDAIALGRLAEKYQKKNGAKSAKFSIILLVLKIAYELTAVVMVFLMMFSVGNTIVIAARGVVTNDASAAISGLAALLPYIVSVLVFCAVTIAYKVFCYIALWRVFGIFDSKNATAYTVLSVFFSFLAPIFVFVLRNKKPQYTYAERIQIRTMNNFHTVYSEPVPTVDENAAKNTENTENTDQGE